MNARISKPLILGFLAVLLLFTAACSFSSIKVGDNKAEISVTLDEKQINEMLAHSNDKIEDEDVVLRKITSVDLQEGFIRVFGEYEAPNGDEREGSYDLALSAEDGQLKAEITGVDIEGMELSDARIERMNKRIADELENSYQQSKDEVTYKSVTITDESVKMVVETTWKNQKGE